MAKKNSTSNVESTFKMTHWNYRLIELLGPNKCKSYAIYEVYYEHKKIIATSQDPEMCYGYETIKEAKASLELIATAFGRPVLKWKEMPKWFKKDNKRNIKETK